ncbi:hypothetical protein PQ43W_47 [Ralstonia phage PQ43W]
MAQIWHEYAVSAGGKLYRKTDGAVIATFSSQQAAQHAHDMLREGNYSSARWHTNGPTNSADRTTFDALPK